MDNYVLFGIYLLLFNIILIRVNTGRTLFASNYLLLLAFNFKVIIGCLYGKFYVSQIPHADTWNFFFHGNKINDEHWRHFLRTDLPNNYNILSSSSFFNYYRYVIMDQFSAICSLITGGRYYCNVIIFNFLTFLGLLQCYRFLVNQNARIKWIFFSILFFFPPFVFWTSGFHRDGLLMAFLGCFLLQLQNYFKTFRYKNLFLVVLTVLLMVFMRSFWGFASIIVAILWFIAVKVQSKKIFRVFGLGMVAFLILFVLLAFAPDNFNFALNLVKKQEAFLSLSGSSELPIGRLSVTLTSYWKTLLDAYNHLLFRPYLNEIGTSPLYILAFLENLLVWILIILAVIFRINGKSKDVMMRAENNVLLYLVLIAYTVIGITVPFLGAIVRYKAPFEVLLIIFLVQFIPYEYLSKIVPGRFRNHS